MLFFSKMSLCNSSFKRNVVFFIDFKVYDNMKYSYFPKV